MSKICTFFGHRDAPNRLFYTLKCQIEELILQGYSEFWCGGRGNFDAMAAQAVRQLKKCHTQLTLSLLLSHLPVKNNENTLYLQQQYDELVYLEGLELGLQRFAICKRNRLMVAQSDYIIFYVHKEFGGAYAALKYAKSQKKNFVNLSEPTAVNYVPIPE